MGVVYALLRQRHRYYRTLLIVEVMALLGLRGLQEIPQLVSLVYLLISGVGVLMDSPLLPQNRLTPQLQSSPLSLRLRRRLDQVIQRRSWLKTGWLMAAGVELLWQASLLLAPTLAIQLSVIHLVVWLVLMLYMLWTLINALAEEPIFSGALLMGAAAGYLLIGFTGGMVLNSLLVLDPAAFSLRATASALPIGIAHAPATLGAAFGCLTTLGTTALNPHSLTGVSASAGITIVGQLYVAILIAGILGKPRRLADVRKAAHRTTRPRVGSSRLKRSRP